MDMGEKTAIQWCDHTFSPWWGCTEVSPGCVECYAKRWAKRAHVDWGAKAIRRQFGDNHWHEPERWNRKAQSMNTRHRVFCGSMCDVFEVNHYLDQDRERLFELIESTAYLDWLLLTKRIEDATKLVPDRWRLLWPQNIWAGCTVESAEYLPRIGYLLSVPTHNHFVSVEPMLGPMPTLGEYLDGISWVIGGGESGPKARPMHPDWARSVRDQCQTAGVPFFFKQWGEWIESVAAEGEPQKYPTTEQWVGKDSQSGVTPGVWMRRIGKRAAGRMLDGRTWDEFPEVRP
jgi:protein gp37